MTYEAMLMAGGKALWEASKTPLSNMMKVKIDELRVDLTNIFSGSINVAKNRCSSVKNIIYRGTPANLRDLYVNINFAIDENEVTDDTLQDAILNRKKIIISGRAGFRKTMFMKWSTLNIIESHAQHQLYPIFFELRNIDEKHAEMPFESILFDNSASSKDKSTFQQFIIGLQRGFFLITLDAFDEINPKFRERVLQNLTRFIRDYPECGIVLSTRPDDQIESIEEFSVYRSLSMNQAQIIEVISKIDFDDTIKTNLISKLNSGYFERNKDFLISPLMATIMLLSFSNSADIPNRQTLFYKEAFESLYLRHDVHKGSFRREYHSKLQIDQFEKVFSVFCYNTLRENELEFDYTKLIARFRQALGYFGHEVDPEEFAKDVIHVASLIVKDGNQYEFSHKSFQEYFAARFLQDYRGPDIFEKIDGVSRGIYNRNLMGFLAELSEDLFEREWLLKRCNLWLDSVGRVRLNTKSGLRTYFENTYQSLGYSYSGRILNYGLGWGKESCGWLSLIESVYTDLVFANSVFLRTFRSLDVIADLIPPDDRKASILYNEFVARSKLVQEREGSSIENDCADVKAKDAPWLIYSGLHEAFQETRQSVKALVKQIYANQERRAQSFSRIENSKRKWELQ